MRDILFTGFHPSADGKQAIFLEGKEIKGEWVEGDLIHGVAEQEGIVFIRSKTTDNPFGYVEREVIPETVGQFSGLTDKNGTKFFEKNYWIDTDEGDIFVVEFRDGQFCFVLYGVSGALMEYGWDESAGGFGECDCSPMTDYVIENIEIIGNILDNPELLNKN